MNWEELLADLPVMQPRTPKIQDVPFLLVSIFNGLNQPPPPDRNAFHAGLDHMLMLVEGASIPLLSLIDQRIAEWKVEDIERWGKEIQRSRRLMDEVGNILYRDNGNLMEARAKFNQLLYTLKGIVEELAERGDLNLQFPDSGD